MAGGLFGKPFILNEKCIFFSIICSTLFLYKPNYNNSWQLYLSLFILFVLSYVGMAWYDYIFDCNLLPLKRGSIGGVTKIFKPRVHNKEKQEQHHETKRENKIKKMIIYISHILFIVPLLLYVVIYKTKVNKMIYPLLGTLAVFTALYHGFHILIFKN
jgi:hypothetical protein